MVSSTAPSIDALRAANGHFSMLAIDQRESLRQMLAKAKNASVSDAELVDFKLEIVRTLTPYASAVLIDHTYGGPAAAVSECPVILAADILFQGTPSGAVNRAEIDPVVTPELVNEFGAAALKMLVPWLPDQRQAAIDLSADFMALCRASGVPGVVEGVVRPDDIATWSDADRNEALVTAAKDLASTQPDLYKGEVPQYGLGNPDDISAVARQITEVVDCPWVVLSSGVRADLFGEAVRACVVGGASGFLAGRAIWADAITASDPEAFLANESATRLRSIADLIAQV